MAGYGTPIELAREVDQAEAETALKILNWYFDSRPDQYLIQKPRVVYDSAGRQKITVRYYIKTKEQEQPETAEQKSNQQEERKSDHEQGTIQQQDGSMGDA